MRDLKKNSVLVRLMPWMEVRGRLSKIESDKTSLYLEVDRELFVFRKELVKASLITEDFLRNAVGHDIAVLRTDMADKPVLIQLILAKKEIDFLDS